MPILLNLCALWNAIIKAKNLLKRNFKRNGIIFNFILSDKEKLSIDFKTYYNKCRHYGESNGNPLQYSCLENYTDGGAWWAAVHGVSKSQTRLRGFTFTLHFHALEKELATHSSVLALRIPGKGELGGPPSMGSHRVGHDWSNLAAAADITLYIQFSSVAQSCLTLCDPMNCSTPCPSPTPGVHSNSRPSSQWCHPAISSSVVPFSSCPQSLPASESFPMSQFFAWCGQSTGVSALASVLPKKSQGWSPDQQCSKFSKPGCCNTWTVKYQMFKLVLEKAEEPEIKLPTSTGSWKKQKSSRKTSTSALLTIPKPLIVWIKTNCGKFLKR